VQLRHGNEELKALNRIGTLISASLDQSQLFRILARESRRVLPWDGFFIALTEKGSEEVQLTFMTSSGDEITQRSMQRGTGLTGRALKTGETILYERGDKDPAEEEGPLGGKKARSIVVAPMKFNEEIIGAISVQSFQSDVYRQSELRLLQTIAAQAAVAVRNAQLFRSEQTAKNERDEFLSLVTHEIKNPLTSIQGYADIGEKALESGDRELVIEALSVVRTETKRILRLTEDLLDASKAAAGKFTVKFEVVPLGPLVREIVSRYEATTRRSITYQEEEKVSPVKADPVRLSQVIENLVSNAVKYSPPGSPISVTLQQNGGYVRLSVTDQGLGIPPEKLPLIFERFYRVTDGGGTEVKGTGLGLFITREIVRMHGGEIQVESTPEKGSTFTVDLPAAVGVVADGQKHA
jgi:signal transduction histidine kinase